MFCAVNTQLLFMLVTRCHAKIDVIMMMFMLAPESSVFKTLLANVSFIFYVNELLANLGNFFKSLHEINCKMQ